MAAALVVAALAAGCAGGTSAEVSGAGGSAETAVSSPVQASTEASEELVTLSEGESLDGPGSFRFDLGASHQGDYPALVAEMPAGWVAGDGWLVGVDAQDIPPVAVQFWNVDQLYAHPCQWVGTEFQPGRGVEDLANALVEVPMRNATTPIDVQVGGFPGLYLEWTVPSDLEFNDETLFTQCDGDPEGFHDFRSWTGLRPSVRYHQGPGQVDHLWILDIDGERLVIDAFSMPSATAEDLAAMRGVVESIRFEVP